MKSVILCLLIVGSAAVEPSERAVNKLAQDLQTQWGSRLSESEALRIAHEQLQWAIDNRNNTEILEFQELEPMLADCPALPPRAVPTTITDLHPQDVKVIAAVGDSISTGCNALSTNWFNLKDSQDLSWSMGGDDSVITLPSLLKQYNPNLIGAASNKDNRGFNFAKNGAIVQDVPGQVDALISALRAAPNVDFDNDWKVVTLLIGGNNLCDVCKDRGDNDAAAYTKYLDESLAKLSTLKRTYVNLVSHLDYTQIAQYKGPFCSIVLPFVCKCLTSSSSGDRDVSRREIDAYNAVIDSIGEKYRRDDFAVVVQPNLIQTIVPDRSYISTADCFHPSGSGQRMFATALWNSMITPVADKKVKTATANDLPECANADTLLYV